MQCGWEQNPLSLFDKPSPSSSQSVGLGPAASVTPGGWLDMHIAPLPVIQKPLGVGPDLLYCEEPPGGLYLLLFENCCPTQ